MDCVVIATSAEEYYAGTTRAPSGRSSIVKPRPTTGGNDTINGGGLNDSLRGGAYLLLAMEVNDVRKDWLDNLRDDARRRLREGKIGVSAVGVAGNAVQVRIAKPEETDAALRRIKVSSPAPARAHEGTLA